MALTQDELIKQIKEQFEKMPGVQYTSKALANLILGSEQLSATNRIVNILRILRDEGYLTYQVNESSTKKPGSWVQRGVKVLKKELKKATQVKDNDKATKEWIAKVVGELEQLALEGKQLLEN